MRKLLVLALASMMLLSACNTFRGAVNGVGKDTAAAGCASRAPFLFPADLIRKTGLTETPTVWAPSVLQPAPEKPPTVPETKWQ